jgi:hypothetical protein
MTEYATASAELQAHRDTNHALFAITTLYAKSLIQDAVLKEQENSA